MRLDRMRIFRFSLGMRQSARYFLRLVMVAVAICASGLNGYAGVLAAFDVHAHGHHGMHSHPAHDHGFPLDTAHATLGQDYQDEDHPDEDPASSEQPCTHVHAHCCSTFAVPAGDCGLKAAAFGRAAVPVAVTHSPPGQLVSSLFRPPRASV